MLHPISYLPSKWAPKVDGPPVHLLWSNWSPRQSSCSPRDHLLQSKWVYTNLLQGDPLLCLWVCVNILAMMQLVKHLCVWVMTCPFLFLSVCRRWLPRRASPTSTFYLSLPFLSLYNSCIVKFNHVMQNRKNMYFTTERNVITCVWRMNMCLRLYVHAIII